MAIEKRTRWLEWEGCRNARDLGGYPTIDGKETRWGAIVRSDEPSALTATGKAALIAYGIGTIIDIRWLGETEQFPNPFATPGAHHIAYMNLSLNDPGEAASPGHYTSLTDDHTLADDYLKKLERSTTRIAAIVTAIARTPDAGILVHCADGKDRTGLICALMLSLVGVDDETVAADYALSAEVCWPEDADWLETGPGERATRERDLARWAARPEVMRAVMEQLDARYGSVEAYLLRAGVTLEDIRHVRERLVSP